MDSGISMLGDLCLRTGRGARQVGSANQFYGLFYGRAWQGFGGGHNQQKAQQQQSSAYRCLSLAVESFLQGVRRYVQL